MRVRGQYLSLSEHKFGASTLFWWVILNFAFLADIAFAEQNSKKFAQCHDLKHLTAYTENNQSDEEVMLTPPKDADDETRLDYAIRRLDEGENAKKEALILLESLIRSDDNDVRNDAIYYLSRLYRYDYPTKENLEKALNLHLNRALNNTNDYDAFMDIAEVYEQGIGVEPDFESAGMWYWRANNVFAGGEPGFRLAELYRRNRIGSTWNEDSYPIFYYEVAEEQGAGNTVLSALSELYLKGQGVKPDSRKAEELYELAYEGNDFFAQVRHDILTAADSGTLKFQNWSFAEARSRADAGDIDGLFLAGHFSAIGRKTDRDLFAAHDFLSRASSLGHAKAPYLLLYMEYHLLPRMVLHNSADELLFVSADRGYWRAQQLLGTYVSTGRLGDLDIKCGTYWYEKGLLGEAETKGPDAVLKVQKRIASGEPYFPPRCTEEQIKNAKTVIHWDRIGPFGTWISGVKYDDCAVY